MIELAGLRKTHRDGSCELCVLDGVDLSVGGGEFVTLLGRSGSGKTTLLGILGGLDSRYEGRVAVGGVDLAGLGERQRSQFRSRQLGFIFQGHNLLPRLSALENVELPALFAGGPPPPRGRALAVLEQVGLGSLAQARAERLSGGESQRVAIARALYLQPKLLLCDEPTGNLDEESAAEIAALFARLQREEKLTVVVATHDPALWKCATRTLRLGKGKLSMLEVSPRADR